MRGRGSGLSLGVVVGCLLGALGGAQAVSCTLALDSGIACGDGFVDEEAGEECDPGDEDSFIGACAGTEHSLGDGACDPVTCTVIKDSAQCAVCGDGLVDEGEQCDESNLDNNICPSGNGQLRCNDDCTFDLSNCDPCGNGVVDEGEECDKADIGGLATPRPCAGANLGGPNELPPITPPITGKPYTFGESSTCDDSCRYVRLGCSYCGDEILDGPKVVDFDGNETLAEVCDDQAFDEDVIFERFPVSLCYMIDEIEVRPNIGCAAGCLDFEERPEEEPCCRKAGEKCPSEVGDQFECCYAYDHPGEDPCVLIIDQDGQQQQFCR